MRLLRAAAGRRLGGFLPALGFMLPGLLLMLGLSVLHVEADLRADPDELFYGLAATVGAIVARALVRLSRTFISDVPWQRSRSPGSR